MSPVSTIRRYAELGVDPDPSEAWRVRCGRVGQGDRAASEQARSDQARGKWTRIKREIADFFTNKESEYFDLVGSEIPLRWLAMKPGHEPRRRFTEVEIENEELFPSPRRAREAHETIAEFKKATGR